MVSANSKLKSLFAVRQLLFKVPTMYSRGQAQIPAEAVAESHWLFQTAQKSYRSVHLGDQRLCALAKLKPALLRISPKIFLCLSTGVGCKPGGRGDVQQVGWV